MINTLSQIPDEQYPKRTMTGQVQLFPAPRTLEECLGRDLFDGMPNQPGIYRFYDQAGSLLYVGKAANLRKRLASYRRARSGKVPRKVAELASRIHRIETVVLASADEALLAENLWIRNHRPPYNHANKHTETYYYIIMSREADALKVRLSMSLQQEDSSMMRFGCFKGHIRVRRMLGSLLQLWWLALNRPASPHFLPVQLTRRITPLNYRLRFLNDPVYSGEMDDGDIYAGDVLQESTSHIVDEISRDSGPVTTDCPKKATDPIPDVGICFDPDEMLLLIRNWFEGRSEVLLKFIAEKNRDFADLSSFNRLYIDAAMDQLISFYTNILIPHRQMREIWLNGQSLIGCDELDDLLVKRAAAERKAAGRPGAANGKS